MTSLLLGLLAGTLTTLSPCVLPVLPFVVLAALDRHRFGPLALAAGMAATFAAVGLAVSGAGAGLDARPAAASLMAFFGVLLLSPGLQARLAVLAAPLTARLGDAASRFGAGGGLGA